MEQEENKKSLDKLTSTLKYQGVNFLPPLTEEASKELLKKYVEREWPVILQFLFTTFYARFFVAKVKTDGIKFFGKNKEKACLQPSEDQISETLSRMGSIDPKTQTNFQLEIDFRSAFPPKCITQYPRFIIEENYAFWELDGIIGVNDFFEMKYNFRQKFPKNQMVSSLAFNKNDIIYIEMKSSLFNPQKKEQELFIEKQLLKFANRLEHHFLPLINDMIPPPRNERYLFVYNFADDSQIDDSITVATAKLEKDATIVWFTKKLEVYWIHRREFKSREEILLQSYFFFNLKF